MPTNLFYISNEMGYKSDSINLWFDIMIPSEPGRFCISNLAWQSNLLPISSRASYVQPQSATIFVYMNKSTLAVLVGHSRH